MTDENLNPYTPRTDTSLASMLVNAATEPRSWTLGDRGLLMVEAARRLLDRAPEPTGEDCTHPGCTLHRDHHGAHDDGTWPRTVSLDVPEWVAERINQPGPLADPILVAWCVSAIAKAAGIR